MNKTKKALCCLLTATSVLSSAGITVLAAENDLNTTKPVTILKAVSEATVAVDLMSSNDTDIVPYGVERHFATVDLGVCTAYPWIMMNFNTGIFSQTQHGCSSSSANYIVLYNLHFDNKAA